MLARMTYKHLKSDCQRWRQVLLHRHPRGQLLSFQMCVWGERSRFGELLNSTLSFSCCFCRRRLCHIQLSKCTRQQSLLVMRALGRNGFLTSSPEIFPARHEAEMCSDALLCRNGPWISQRFLQSSRSGLMGRSLLGCCQLGQKCCLHKSLGAILLHFILSEEVGPPWQNVSGLSFSWKHSILNPQESLWREDVSYVECTSTCIDVWLWKGQPVMWRGSRCVASATPV